MDDGEIYRRLGWLERKVVELIWLVISGSSVFIGWLAANITHESGWVWFAVFVGTWILLAFIFERTVFKGAPERIKYLH